MVENSLHRQGIKFVAGIDEVGVGSLAGPVLAAAIILPHNFTLKGVRDSKKLSPKQRSGIFSKIVEKALAIGIGIVDEKTIDKININNAAMLAMKLAVESLPIIPEYLLIDGRNKIDLTISQRSIIKGDDKCFSIAAASIIAKVIRDRIMDMYAVSLDKYGFSKHKGYGTKLHLSAIKKYGPSPIHRRSYAPISELPETAHFA